MTADEVRLPRLVARHERFGKSPDAAREWVERVDGANAVLIEAAAHRADLILDLTAWEPPADPLTTRPFGPWPGRRALVQTGDRRRRAPRVGVAEHEADQ